MQNKKKHNKKKNTSQLDLNPPMVFLQSSLDQQQLLLHLLLRILHKVHLRKDGAMVRGHLLGRSEVTKIHEIMGVPQ